jgi:hypothetical protein
MSAPRFVTYPGLGEWAKETLHYSQAVRIGNIIKTSGQGQSTILVPKTPQHTLKANLDSNFQAVGILPPTSPTRPIGSPQTLTPRSTKRLPWSSSR